MNSFLRTLLVGASCGSIAIADANVVYSRIVESNLRANANNPGFFGPGDIGSQTRINFDDVPISTTTLGTNTSVRLNSVTVGIRRGQGAAQNNVRVWAAAMNANGMVAGSPIFLGNEILLPRTDSGFSTDLVTVSGLDQTVAANFGFSPGFGSILIGVQLSQDSLAGWRITTGSDYNVTNFANLYETATATNSPYFMAETPFTSFYVSVNATPVPESSTMLACMAGLALFARKGLTKVSTHK